MNQKPTRKVIAHHLFLIWIRHRRPNFSWVDIGKQSSDDERERRKLKFRYRICAKVLVMGNGLTNIKTNFCSRHTNVDISQFHSSQHANRSLNRQKTVNYFGAASAIVSRFKKTSIEQKKHIRLCAEWIVLDFKSLSVVDQSDFVVSSITPTLGTRKFQREKC